VQLTLRGRADGFDPEQGLVEEIKTCRVPAASIPAAVSRLHLAQGRLYAALIARAERRDALTVRLTWLNIDSGEEPALEQHYSRAELDDFLNATLARFADWLRLLAARREQRQRSLADLDVPYGAFRAGQRDMAELVYKCIDQGGQLMLEAPTGIGKTAAVLYPALKALATGKHERILFLTAKTVGRRAAEDALQAFRKNGMSLPALSLTAAERICFSPGKACNGDDCPFARGYYDRHIVAMRQALQAPALQREDIEVIAREHQVCPYQLSIDLLPWMDLVIADLHYLYSLTATFPAMMERDGQRWTALVDEAHNLPGRARSMYAARLAKRDLMAVKRTLPRRLKSSLERLNRYLLKLQKESWREVGFDTREGCPDELLSLLQAFTAAVGEQHATDPVLLARLPGLGEFYFRALQFLRVADRWGDEFRLELSSDGTPQGLELTLNCLDPGRLLGERQAGLHSVTAFSATLSPREWMRRGLGLGPEAVYRRQDSPFESSQLQVSLATGIDTRYRQRGRSLAPLAALILDWLERQTGNCIVYFPSYRYLTDCLGLLQSIGLCALPRTLWEQRRDQADAGRDELLALLDERRDVAAFCILGGVFGEGVDLPGARLTSVVVVGVGLPQFNRDNEQVRAYHQRHLGRGFEYAYLYPGLQKVDQALGRVIRRPEDRGRALLIDSRYAESSYRELLPAWWQYSHYEAD
jgi:DNA excision repair protein ERCC-2